MENSKSTRRALLASACALLVCAAMFTGATYAWFTDTATASVGKIQAGTLDAALQMWDGDDWVSAEGQTLAWKTIDGSTSAVWEPGATFELPMLRVYNAGDRVMKYKLAVTGVDGDNDLLKAIEFSYGGATLDTEMTLDSRKATDGFVITAKMSESAGNEYQGMSIDGIQITVVATQAAAESDSYGSDYDAEATLPVTSASELMDAIANGQDVTVVGSIELPEILEIKNSVTIYGGDGAQLIASEGKNRVINVQDNTESVTIKLSGIDIVGPTTGSGTRGISFYNNSGDVTLVMDDCSVSANYYALNIASNNENIELVVKNSTVAGWSALSTWSAGTKATFENCTFVGTNGFPYVSNGDNDFSTFVVYAPAENTSLEFKNCTFEANYVEGKTGFQYLFNIRAEGVAVTLDDCVLKVNGEVVDVNETSKYVDSYEGRVFDFIVDGSSIEIKY